MRSVDPSGGFGYRAATPLRDAELAVLVLNRSYLPIHVTSVRRAFSLVYQGIARVVDDEYRTFDFEQWSGFRVLNGHDRRQNGHEHHVADGHRCEWIGTSRGRCRRRA